MVECISLRIYVCMHGINPFYVQHVVHRCVLRAFLKMCMYVYDVHVGMYAYNPYVFTNVSMHACVFP